MASISTVLGRLKTLVDSSAEQVFSTTSAQVSASDEQSKPLQDDSSLLGQQTLDSFQRIVQLLLDQTLPLSQSILYWNDVIDSKTNLIIYGTQIAPWLIATGVTSSPSFTNFVSASLSPSTVLSPLYPLRQRAKMHRKAVIAMRDDAALRLGSLIRSGFTIPATSGVSTPDAPASESSALTSSAADPQRLLSTIAICVGELHSAVRSDYSLQERRKNSYTFYDYNESTRPSTIDFPLDTSNLDSIKEALSALEVATNEENLRFQVELKKDGIPSTVVRYWPSAILGVFVLLNVLGSWPAFVHWCRTQVMDTVTSLWKNWIVEPIFRIYSTIRHDDNSQVAIMSGQSLSSDLDSLERMVLDFAKDNGIATDSNQIIAEVKQGDISTVLKSYEQQIQAPITNLIRGDLLRTMLIQVQKTKVDVEVAVSGIDKLIKSQELVFGLIAAFPALVIVWYGAQYIASTIRGKDRVDRSKGRVRESMALSLGNVDSILRGEDPKSLLSAKGLGLVLCETHLLQNLAQSIMPKRRYSQWVEDLQYLESADTVEKQISFSESLWIKYGRYL